MSGSDKLQQERDQLLTRALNAEAEVWALRQTRTQFQRLYDTTVRAFSEGRVPRTADANRFDGITIIIAYYDIPDQIERTIMSCSPDYQGVEADQIEVIIADNGSNLSMHEGLLERFPFVSKVLRTEEQPSPVFALNDAIAQASHSTVAVMIDGAHMLSPGIVTSVKEVLGLFARPVINVPQYILGDVSQNLRSGPDAFEREQRRLDDLNWPHEGYALFDFALFPGERPLRTYFGAIESNCLITTKEVLESCGSFDERFNEPSGGFANLELFSRLTSHPENSYVLLPGEGSFHQDHEGTTTGRSPEGRDRAVAKFRQQYRDITGFDALFNPRSPFLYGEVRQSTQGIPTISREFGKARNRILNELADHYVARSLSGINDDNHPILASNATPLERRAFKQLAPLGLVESEARFSDRTAHDLSYKVLLKKIHTALVPQLYFEIGVDSGASLALSACKSIGVDPEYHITKSITAPARLFRITSDSFFENEARCRSLLSDGIDLSFIDGMHLSEYVLRDFINVELWSRAGGTIIFDDVLPEQMVMAERDRAYNAWCGDVYKIIPVLRKYRPDLQVDVFEAFIGPYRKGVAAIRNLDPGSKILSEHYDAIVADLLGDTYAVSSTQELEDLVQVTTYNDFDHYIASISETVEAVSTV